MNEYQTLLHATVLKKKTVIKKKELCLRKEIQWFNP